MAFCSFSKECDGNSYITVENKFITKYLPEVDGFAVKVYLYGLYLCKNANSDFGLQSMAEVLKTTEEKIVSAFELWQDYDLVEILSKSPFAVQYLPVKSAVGRPKKVHYEQYGDFNKELQRKMQKVGKFISAGDYLKYMRFLEENPMQPQALLLIAEYCINKQGESVSPSYIFNKAQKLLRGGASTYEQVERELSNYNAHEGDLIAVLNALGGFKRVPDETDYSLYRKWTETLGFTKDGVIATAKHLKRGNMNGLDATLEDLYEAGKTEADEISSYLQTREEMANLTFRIARKLGVKVSNPATYIDEYLEKWCTYGFEDSSLLEVALYCLKTERGNFDCMNGVLDDLFQKGIVGADGVKEFLKEKNDELKLFDKIQTLCGSIRKNATNLSLIRTWREWNFNDDMILEAAKRSSSSANPLPYINKILSDWKRQEIFDLKAIPQAEQSANTPTASRFISQAVIDANAKSDRERYYALLREKAQIRADKFVKKANENTRFKEVSSALSKMEFALAKAEVFAPETLPKLQEEKAQLLAEHKSILQDLGIDESDLTPKYTCKKCSDTGYLPSGTACACYKKA